MDEINVEDLRKVVAALKEYRRAQVLAYYGNVVDDIEVSECTSMHRLLQIAHATKSQVDNGLRDSDGSTLTRTVTFEGCTFWAPVNNVF